MEEHQVEIEDRNEVVETEQQTYSTDVLPTVETVKIDNEEENIQTSTSVEQEKSERKGEEEGNDEENLKIKVSNEEEGLESTRIIEIEEEDRQEEKEEEYKTEEMEYHQIKQEEERKEEDQKVNENKNEKEEEEEEMREKQARKKDQTEKSYEDKSMSKTQLEILYKLPQKSNFKVYRPRPLYRRGREIKEVKEPEPQEVEKEIEAIIVNPKVIDYFYNKVKNKPIFMKYLAKIIYLLLNPEIESFPNLNEVYNNIIPFSPTMNSLSEIDVNNINKNTFKRIYKLYKKIQGDFIPENPPDIKNLLTYISKILEYGDYNPPSLFPKIFITNKYLLGIGDVNQTNYFPNRIIYPEIKGAKKYEEKEKKIPKLYKSSEMYLKEMSRPVTYPKEYNVNSSK